METDQLRQFIAVARCGNITSAAAELSISQPALSRSIQRLEVEFGQPLFKIAAKILFESNLASFAFCKINFEI